LDHFKAINDGFGHEAGDAVLVQFSDLVRSSTRKGDRFFRLGGEEFALLLPGADIDALRDITEHLRASVERAVRCDDRPVTISIGATPLAAGESASSWLSRADSAMYLAKGEGRNRVVVVDNDGEVPPRVLR
ncbi:MAG: GGDEF domain-containing protein, partial [Proteobacteria bacterium]|nr:GGDEF domain-containing protein [Pseudomonadota bacterium]